ncbi:MAG: aminotransferase class I/II-fold pyridoxal phosphate-dependent enzyme [Fimbriimonadales bacterium]
MNRREDYQRDPSQLLDSASDLVVIVNPNSPTGQHVPREKLQPIVAELARTRTVWIDEAYIEFAGDSESLEPLAAGNRNVIVCKSMSKVYALSGLRVAYLVSHPDRIEQLCNLRPPWAVSLPAQVCGMLALSENNYYCGRYAETVDFRRELREALEHIGLEVTDGVINCLLVHLPAGSPTAAEICRTTARRGVYLRDAGSMGTTMGAHTIRVSVRAANENARIVEEILRSGVAAPSFASGRRDRHPEPTSASLPPPPGPRTGCRSSTR